MSIPISALAPPVGTNNATNGAVPAATSVPKQAPSEVDKQDFASMMQGFDANSPLQASATQKPHAPSFLESFAKVQHSNMQNVMQSTRDMLKTTPGMSLQELSAVGIEFRLNMAVTTAQFQVATSVGKSAGKGIDTLMRNQ